MQGHLQSSKLEAPKTQEFKGSSLQWSQQGSTEVSVLTDYVLIIKILIEITVEDKQTNGYMDIGLDSNGIKNLVEDWVAKGIMTQEEAQTQKEENQNFIEFLSVLEFCIYSKCAICVNLLFVI